MSETSARRSEQPAAIAVPDLSDAGLALEGIFLPCDDARGAAVMAPPHPLYGGSMENPVVTEVADACHRAGLASLRFNWRGVGASGGEATGDLASGAADYAAALAFAEESSQGPLAACGYSFGAASAVAIARAHERVRALVLIAPPLIMLDRAALASFAGRVLLVAGDRDEYAPMDELEALAAGLATAELVALPGTDHYFMTGLPELGRAAEHFLKRLA
jgi:alpha/beta superfamily hydrolase